jgi:hypothetical protein
LQRQLRPIRPPDLLAPPLAFHHGASDTLQHRPRLDRGSKSGADAKGTLPTQGGHCTALGESLIGTDQKIVIT